MMENTVENVMKTQIFFEECYEITTVGAKTVTLKSGIENKI